MNPLDSTTSATEHWVQGACPHDCPDTCAWQALVKTENGQSTVIKMRGHVQHKHTDGVLCTKVARYPERTYHPDRILQPLKRVGRKGEGRFEAVSWDQALSDIAQQLQRIAARQPLAILPYSYAGTMGLVQGEAMAARFFHRLGACELDRTICASAGGRGLKASYGRSQGMHVQDFVHSRLILIWGSNPITSSVHFWRKAQAAKRQGAKLICIDPRRSETAQHCDQHIAILPGTDGALALALMHELLHLHQNSPTAGFLNETYIANHTDGWDELQAEAKQWPPERAAAICGIPAETIRALAHEYATTQPAAIRLNYGMQRAHGGGNAVRLICALPCITGAWQHKGGGLLLSSSGYVPAVQDSLHRPDLRGTQKQRLLNMTTLGHDLNHAGDAVWGPRIEALIVYNSNPLAIAPDSAAVQQGLARDDLFTVVLEHFQTDTADYADYILPATTQLEHTDLHTSYGHTDVLLNRAAIAPLGLARPNSQIFRDLAQAMGYTESAFTESDEELIAQAFGPDLNLAELYQQGWSTWPTPEQPFAAGQFPTPNGRAQLGSRPDFGLGCPQFIANHESALSQPELAQRYPLAMISPPARHFLNSSFVNVASLQQLEGQPWVEIHPSDASARNIVSGDAVVLFNDRGRYACFARVSEQARPGVVNALGLWWRKQGRYGTNANELTHQKLTDMGAAPSFYDCLVEITKDD